MLAPLTIALKRLALLFAIYSLFWLAHIFPWRFLISSDCIFTMNIDPGHFWGYWRSDALFYTR